MAHSPNAAQDKSAMSSDIVVAQEDDDEDPAQREDEVGSDGLEHSPDPEPQPPKAQSRPTTPRGLLPGNITATAPTEQLTRRAAGRIRPQFGQAVRIF